jgi:hypothetical protein
MKTGVKAHKTLGEKQVIDYADTLWGKVKIGRTRSVIPILLSDSHSKTFNTLCDFYNNTDMIPNELKDWSIPPEFSWFHYVTKNNININVNHWDIKVMRNNIDEVKNKNFDYEIL